MGLKAALLLLPTMTAYAKVSDEWMGQNIEPLLSEMLEALIEDELALRRVGNALDRFSHAMHYTFTINNTEPDPSQCRA